MEAKLYEDLFVMPEVVTTVLLMFQALWGVTC
jgi:hypothetical protein